MNALNSEELSSAFVGLIAGLGFLAFVMILMIIFISSQGKKIRRMQKAGLTQVQVRQIQYIVREAMTQKPDFRGNMNATGLLVSWCTGYFVEVAKLKNVEKFMNDAQQLLARSQQIERGMKSARQHETELDGYKRAFELEMRKSAGRFVTEHEADIRRVVQAEIQALVAPPETRKGVGSPTAASDEDHPTLNYHPDDKDDDNRPTHAFTPVDRDADNNPTHIFHREGSATRAQLQPGQPGYQVPSTTQATSAMPIRSIEALAEKSKKGS